jgi:hypothetical protein
LLRDAERAVEEHAVEQAWRAAAMHKVGERLLEMYHRNRHADALDILESMRSLRADLDSRIERHDERPVRRLRTG